MSRIPPETLAEDERGRAKKIPAPSRVSKSAVGNLDALPSGREFVWRQWSVERLPTMSVSGSIAESVRQKNIRCVGEIGMWFSRLFWKQLLVTTGVFTVLALLFSVGITQMYHRHLQQECHDGLLAAAESLRPHIAALAESQQPLAVALPEATLSPQPALTIVAPDGQVLASNFAEAEDFGDQRRHAEIRSALRGDVGTAQRRDAKTGLWMHYVALPVVQQGNTVAVVRVGKSQQAIQSTTVQSRILVTMLVASVAIASLALVRHFAGRIAVRLAELQQSAEAIAEGDFDHRVSIPRDGEFAETAKAKGLICAVSRPNRRWWSARTKRACKRFCPTF